MRVGRWRMSALILAVVAFGVAGLGTPPWLPSLGFHAGTRFFFWLGVVCFLAGAWGRPGT